MKLLFCFLLLVAGAAAQPELTMPCTTYYTGAVSPSAATGADPYGVPYTCMHGLIITDSAYSVNLTDDFVGGFIPGIGTASQHLGALGWGTTAIAATGCTFGLSANSSFQHPGVLAVTTPAASAEGCSVYLGTGATGMLGTLGNLPYWWSQWIGYDSAVTNVAFRLGFGTSASAATIPTNGIYFRFDTSLETPDTEIMACVDTSGVETCTSTGQTPVAKTEYDFYILVVRCGDNKLSSRD
jgi:hypothetical protein